MWSEATVWAGVCATDVLPASRQNINAVKSNTAVLDNGILMIAVFLLVMEQSFRKETTVGEVCVICACVAFTLGQESFNCISKHIKSA